ncbi:MAG TPA: NfeD family protein [Gaiellaceae bacterium]|nr:NfeD family protein [Gaiellaceae bacterium]
MEGGVAIAVWLAIAAALVVLEVVSLAFVALYVAVGALAAALAAALGAGFGLQLVVFAGVSIGSLLLTRRPLLAAMRRQPQIPSNAPTVVGKHALVTRPIVSGTGQRGQVRVGTEEWSARSESEEALAAGVTVEVMSIDGVTLVVRRVRSVDEQPAGTGSASGR